MKESDGLNQEDINQEALDLFGKLLMKNVRDVAIAFGDQILQGRIKTEYFGRLAQSLKSLDPQLTELIHQFVPEIVDETLYLLMNMVDGSSGTKLELMVHTEQGTVPNLSEASEDLNLEIYGWIARFSKQRISSKLEGVTLPEDRGGCGAEAFDE